MCPDGFSLYHPDNKATYCANNIAKYYNKFNAQKGTQFVFSDLGTYKPNEWNIYSEIKRKLVEEHGISAHEIRFIQEAKNNKQREALIKGMNDGRIQYGHNPVRIKIHLKQIFRSIGMLKIDISQLFISSFGQISAKDKSCPPALHLKTQGAFFSWTASIFLGC